MKKLNRQCKSVVVNLVMLRKNCVYPYFLTIWMDFFLGWFGFNSLLRQYLSLYQAVSQREGERREKIEKSKNVQTTPTRTYCRRNKPLPYYHPNCRTPRHRKFTQDHRTTRSPHNWMEEIYIWPTSQEQWEPVPRVDDLHVALLFTKQIPQESHIVRSFMKRSHLELPFVLLKWNWNRVPLDTHC